MTCFWDGIYKSLNENDFKFIGEKKTNIRSFINILKIKNTQMIDVLWLKNKLKTQEIKEHMEAINNYNINKIHRGHLTSSCDSFLLLICQLFQVKIIHHYCNNTIIYNNSKKERKTLHFSSTSSHFVYSR
tara:strand:- start:58 stop:447 length:390 start_codon:yes stop_codon:yes gene_type:complete